MAQEPSASGQGRLLWPSVGGEQPEEGRVLCFPGAWGPSAVTPAGSHDYKESQQTPEDRAFLLRCLPRRSF